MLKWLMRKGIAAFERKWDYDASYVRELIDADPVSYTHLRAHET